MAELAACVWACALSRDSENREVIPMVARKFLACLTTCVAGVVGISAPAAAEVFQSDAAKTPLPQPVGTNEMNLITQSWAFNTMTQVNKDAMGVDVNQQ